MTRREFAELMDVSVSAIGKWELGTNPPTRDHRIALTAIARMHQTVFTSRQLPGEALVDVVNRSPQQMRNEIITP
jgi:transcriptional regulator with XRE-family HTH domain